MRTQVAIIGGGPAGLLLSQLLHMEGIDNVVLERKSRAYVEARIRAGVLEPGSVDLLTRVGVGERLHREGLYHHGFNLFFGDEMFRVDMSALAGAGIVVYGQTEITHDLYELRLKLGGKIVFEADEVTPSGFDGDKPTVTYKKDGVTHELACDFIAGCDGFHGVSRTSIPERAITNYERIFPFGWLGVLADTPPVNEELIYCRRTFGFALCTMRSMTRSRYYIQVPLTDRVEEWPDDRFWSELRRYIPEESASTLVTGPSIEKSIAPLRSYVCEPMRFGRMFLAGDAAHIVPPTGAKGLNLALADVERLATAFAAHYRHKDDGGLERYSDECLRRVWQAVRFSWWYTILTHKLDDDPFTARLQETEFDTLAHSPAAARAVAESYIGDFWPSLRSAK